MSLILEIPDTVEQDCACLTPTAGSHGWWSWRWLSQDLRYVRGEYVLFGGV